MSRAVLVPVKAPGQAKSRLRGVLDDGARTELARELARRAVLAAVGARRADRVWVVSRDPEVLERARSAGAGSVDERDLEETDDEARALNAALEHARARAIREGSSALAVVMSDLPRVTSADVDALLAELDGAGPRVVLAPDVSGRGLGALALSPADCVAFAFGGGRALERHVAAAADGGLEAVRVVRPGLAFDLDTAEDLAVSGLGEERA